MPPAKVNKPDPTESRLRSAADAGDVEAIHDLGLILRAHGRIADAEALYKGAIERGIEDLLLDYGNLLAEQPARYEEAERAYRRALDAGDTQAHNNLAQLLTEMGRLDEAEIEYRRGIRAGDLKAQRDLGLFLHEEGRFDEAAKELNKALAAGDSQVHLDLADLFEETGRTEDAQRHRAAARGFGLPPDDSPISEWRKRGATD